MGVTNLVKEVGAFLGASGMCNPSDDDWDAALKLILFYKRVRLDDRERGEFNMIRHDMFKNGISESFLKREAPEEYKRLREEKERNARSGARK